MTKINSYQRSLANFKKVLQQLYPNQFIVKQYVNQRQPVILHCNHCNFDIKTSYYKLVTKQQGCYICKFIKQLGSNRKLLTPFTKEQDKVTIKCLVCGNVYQTKVYVARKSKQCNYCAYQQRAISNSKDNTLLNNLLNKLGYS